MSGTSEQPQPSASSQRGSSKARGIDAARTWWTATGPRCAAWVPIGRQMAPPLRVAHTGAGLRRLQARLAGQPGPLQVAKDPK